MNAATHTGHLFQKPEIKATLYIRTLDGIQSTTWNILLFGHGGCCVAVLLISWPHYKKL